MSTAIVSGSGRLIGSERSLACVELGFDVIAWRTT